MSHLLAPEALDTRPEILPVQVSPDGYTVLHDDQHDATTFSSLEDALLKTSGEAHRQLRRIRVRTADDFRQLEVFLLSDRGRSLLKNIGTINIIASNAALDKDVRCLLALVKELEHGRAKVRELIGPGGKEELRRDEEWTAVHAAGQPSRTREEAEAKVDRHLDRLEGHLQRKHATTVKLGDAAVTPAHIKRLLALKAVHGHLLGFDESLLRTLRVMFGREQEPQEKWGRGHARFGARPESRAAVRAMLATLGIISTKNPVATLTQAECLAAVDALQERQVDTTWLDRKKPEQEAAAVPKAPDTTPIAAGPLQETGSDPDVPYAEIYREPASPGTDGSLSVMDKKRPVDPVVLAALREMNDPLPARTMSRAASMLPTPGGVPPPYAAIPLKKHMGHERLLATPVPAGEALPPTTPDIGSAPPALTKPKGLWGKVRAWLSRS